MTVRRCDRCGKYDGATDVNVTVYGLQFKANSNFEKFGAHEIEVCSHCAKAIDAKIAQLFEAAKAHPKKGPFAMPTMAGEE